MGEAKRRRGWICACGASNKAPDNVCETCGEIRPAVALEAGSKGQPECYIDGEMLQGDGFCVRGGGYPLNLVCHFACPYCRGPLGWDGGCGRCFGSLTSTDRRTWTFPGDRYELDDERGQPRGDGKHWVLVAKGPRPVYRPTKGEYAGLQQMLASVGGAKEATGC